MLIEQLEKKKDFTASELQITEYVISHGMQIMDLTAEQLAEKTYTSKASVIRFCRRIGSAGGKPAGMRCPGTPGRNRC